MRGRSWPSAGYIYKKDLFPTRSESIMGKTHEKDLFERKAPIIVSTWKCAKIPRLGQKYPKNDTF